MPLAIGSTNSGGGDKTAGATTTFALDTLNTNAAGDVYVVIAAVDNAGTSGVSAFSSGSYNANGSGGSIDSVRTIANLNRTAGSAANDGCTLVVLAMKVVNPWAPNTAQFTLNWSPNVTAKAYVALRITGGADPSAVTVATSTGTGTGPSVASGSSPTRGILNGDAVFGLVAVESNTAITVYDADTTGGSWNNWSNQASGGSGGDATKMSLGIQTKVVNADGAQTFNPTITNTDYAIAVIAFGTAAPPASFVIRRPSASTRSLIQAR